MYEVGIIGTEGRVIVRIRGMPEAGSVRVPGGKERTLRIPHTRNWLHMYWGADRAKMNFSNGRKQ